MSTLKPLQIDIVSDVVCPWCYIGKRRIENALALVPDVPVEVQWRPFFLNPWVPREGISRDEYLTAKFGSVDRYMANARRVVETARQEGLLLTATEVLEDVQGMPDQRVPDALLSRAYGIAVIPRNNRKFCRYNENVRSRISPNDNGRSSHSAIEPPFVPWKCYLRITLPEV